MKKSPYFCSCRGTTINYPKRKKMKKQHNKRKKEKATNLDVIKAMRRGNREAYSDILGPGFHSFNKVHKSKKTYTRKTKHKNTE